MAAKTEEKEALPAPAGDKSLVPAAAPAPHSGLGAWIPAIAAIVLAPAVSVAVAQFVLLPRLQKTIAAAAAAPVVAGAPGSAPATAAPAPAAEAKTGKDAAGAATPTYEFKDVVVNLSGTMGTRYLKTAFVVSGADASLHQLFEDHKAQLTDVTLNVLSSLTLADLEEPGSKNVLREKLVNAYNQALGRRIADQVYFSDFVVQ
jgi:flagellar FliL protein